MRLACLQFMSHQCPEWEIAWPIARGTPDSGTAWLKFAGRVCSVLVAVLLVALTYCATTTAAPYTPHEARRRLLQEAIGGGNLTVSEERVITQRSKILKNRQATLANPLKRNFSGIKHIQDLEAPLEPERSTAGLNVHFYYRLDASRTDAEVDYIKNKLMPATATVLSRSIRVCNAHAKRFVLVHSPP
jgi:hypothetical protein